MNLGVLTWTSHIFEELEEEGHTIPHWKALRYGKGDLGWQSCGSTLNIIEDVLKRICYINGNLLIFNLEPLYLRPTYHLNPYFFVSKRMTNLF